MRAVKGGVDLDRRQPLGIALQMRSPLREVLGILAWDRPASTADMNIWVWQRGGHHSPLPCGSGAGASGRYWACTACQMRWALFVPIPGTCASSSDAAHMIAAGEPKCARS